MKKLISLFILMTAICSCSAPENNVYMFSYFTDNGQDGLHLAYSYDGLKWEALNDAKSFLAPQVGEDKLMRDPSIVQDDNGTFHMVWTTGWWDQGIGYASSKDLVNWSEQKNIPVMDKFPGTENSWAPELFYDRATKTFYIFWSSTVDGAFEDKSTESEGGLNHRQYYVTTKDFETFSETELYFAPDFCVIDGAVIKKGKEYYLFVKNENLTPPEKNIRVTSNSKPYDFPTEVSEPITGDYWAEGPAPLQVGEYVYVYFDKYMEGKYGAVRTKDMKTWEDVSDMVTFPEGVRHGTAFKVPVKVFEGLVR